VTNELSVDEQLEIMVAEFIKEKTAEGLAPHEIIDALAREIYLNDMKLAEKAYYDWVAR